MKPFVKWVGGKTQLLEKLNLIVPEYERIVEPFVGGGAFFINRKSNFSVINDVNKELIISYKVIKENPKDLMEKLLEYEKLNSENFYYELRNKNIENLNSNIEIAARFIYLNKASFNGIYRVNSNNKFNVPYNYKNNLITFNHSNIMNLSNYFNISDLKIYNYSYEKIFKLAKKNDLFFIDPPYDKENERTFTSYQKDIFGKEQQIKLSNFINLIDKKGVKFILTNHNTILINDLYSKYNKVVINSNRMINVNGEKRSMSAEEIIIFNFDISLENKKELDFLYFFDKMIQTNKRFKNLVDWTKVYKNQIDVEYKLNQLNFLISDNNKSFSRKLEFLYKKDQNSFSILPMLIAERQKKISIYDDNNDLVSYDFKNIESLKKIELFFDQSNLKSIFLNKKISSLSDYYIGVEVGLDSNARKNRNGIIYESLVEDLLKKYKIKYSRQENLFEMKKIKRVDFLIKIEDNNYAIETNFYNSGGSKLNSICRDYITLNKLLKEKGYKFIWLTDGIGWKSAKSSLREAFFNIDYVFNFHLFEIWLKNITKNNETFFNFNTYCYRASSIT